MCIAYRSEGYNHWPLRLLINRTFEYLCTEFALFSWDLVNCVDQETLFSSNPQSKSQTASCHETRRLVLYISCTFSYSMQIHIERPKDTLSFELLRPVIPDVSAVGE